MSDQFFGKIRVWAIVGEPEAGKSTMIGHLTSKFGTTKSKNGLRAGRKDGMGKVLLRGGGYLTIWSRAMAPQEGEVDRKRVPKEFVEEITRQVIIQQNLNPDISLSWFNVLTALRFDADKANPINYPKGYEYLSHFVKANWEIKSLVLMPPHPNDPKDVKRYHNFGVPTYNMQDKPIDTDNENKVEIAWRVGQVRNHFGWA